MYVDVNLIDTCFPTSNLLSVHGTTRPVHPIRLAFSFREVPEMISSPSGIDYNDNFI
jgi:hypothetical protein